MMKHVVILKSHAAQAGGLEKSASRIASAFVKEGAHVSILTTGDAPANLPNISFHAIKPCRWLSSLRMEQFDRFTRDWTKLYGADLIFGMDRNREQTHIRAGNGVHAAYLESRSLAEGMWKTLSFRCNPMHRKILELERFGFEHPQLKKLFTNSFMVRQQILERYKVDPAKITVIHNGVEWHEMHADFANWPSKKPQKLSEWKLPNTFHFLFVGSGYGRKGLKQLLLGLSLLQTNDVHLSVVGKDRNQQKYVALAERLGLSKQVHFFGPQPDIRPFYQMADVLVIPSFYDPFANVTVEALAMGLFVITSRHNGGSEIVHEDNGLIVEDLLDPEAMADALKRALAYPKTKTSAETIRETVKHLDFSIQMPRLIRECFYG